MNRNVTILITILTIILIAGYFVWLRGKFQTSPALITPPAPRITVSPTQIPTPTIAASPTATPTTTITPTARRGSPTPTPKEAGSTARPRTPTPTKTVINE